MCHFIPGEDIDFWKGVGGQNFSILLGYYGRTRAADREGRQLGQFAGPHLARGPR